MYKYYPIFHMHMKSKVKAINILEYKDLLLNIRLTLYSIEIFLKIFLQTDVI